MPGHDYHPGLPGYTENQLLHKGCAECEARAGSLDRGIANLTTARFAKAWHRAAQWKGGDGELPDVDEAEKPMLGALWAVQCQLEQLGIPLGALPVGAGRAAGTWLDETWLGVL